MCPTTSPFRAVLLAVPGISPAEANGTGEKSSYAMLLGTIADLGLEAVIGRRIWDDAAMLVLPKVMEAEVMAGRHGKMTDLYMGYCLPF